MSTRVGGFDSQSLLPADVRNAPTAVRQQYQAALSFESQLVQQLTKSLSATAGDSMESSPYAQLMPEALADSITQAGGLGLAREMVQIPSATAAAATTTDSTATADTTATAAASGGVAA